MSDNSFLFFDTIQHDCTVCLYNGIDKKSYIIFARNGGNEYLCKDHFYSPSG